MSVGLTSPPVISLDTACAITELSKRTFWRRIAKGEFTRVADDARGRAMLLWSEVAPHIGVPIAIEDQSTILLADAGNAEAQDDIGQLLLNTGKFDAAIYWLQLAAKQNQPNAMQCLGRSYAQGDGVPKDENLGIMWIAKAAAHGHQIAQVQIDGLLWR